MTEFVEPDSYSGGGGDEDITFKYIVLKQLLVISKNANNEFRGSYWLTKVVDATRGITEKVYVPDSREVYSNSVEYLRDILYPYFDQKTKKVSDWYDERMSVHRNHFKQFDLNDEKDTRKFLHMDHEQATPNRIKLREVQRSLAQKLFRQLTVFLKGIDYLNGKAFEDSVQ